MSRLTIQHADVVADIRGRLRESPGKVAEASTRLVTAAQQLQATAAAEVAQRRAALDGCDPDDAPRVQARLARAEEASAVATGLVQSCSALSGRMRAVSEETAAAAGRQLARVHAAVVAMGEAPGGAGSGAGGPAGGAGAGGGAGGPAESAGAGGGRSGTRRRAPEGSLPADTPAAVYDALWEYSREPNGKDLNNRARLGATTAGDQQIMAALDDGFARAEPLRADTTFEREVGLDFFPALSRTAKTPEAIVGRLDAGAALYDRGYVSTATTGGTFPKDKVHVTLDVPAGTPVIDMERERPGTPRTVTSLPGERERLLPRGGYVWAVPGTAKYDAVTGDYRVRMRYHRYG